MFQIPIDKIEKTSYLEKCTYGGTMWFWRGNSNRIIIFTLVITQQYKLRYIYLFHNLINKLFSEENEVSTTLFEARKGGRVHHT